MSNEERERRRWTVRGFAIALVAVELAAVGLALGAVAVFAEWSRVNAGAALVIVALLLLTGASAPFVAAVKFAPMANELLWRMPREDIPLVVDAMRPRGDLLLTVLLAVAALPPLIVGMALLG